jgi:histidine ammonia-lyase
MIRESTSKIETYINAPNDNRIIDHVNRKALHGENLKGSAMGFYMDYVHVVVAGLGRVLFTKFMKLMIKL